LAAGEFDIFLTGDRNLSHQQNLSAFDIAVIVLVAAGNRIDDLRPLVPRVLEVCSADIPRARSHCQSRRDGAAACAPVTFPVPRAAMMTGKNDSHRASSRT
jgi:hypothetical protein